MASPRDERGFVPGLASFIQFAKRADMLPGRFLGVRACEVRGQIVCEMRCSYPLWDGVRDPYDRGWMEHAR